MSTAWPDELAQLGITGEKISGRDDPSTVYFDQMPATREFLQDAARLGWLQAKAKDFTTVDGYFVDKGTKALYRRVPGNPLLGDDPAGAVSVYFVDGDALVCLALAEPFSLPALQERNQAAEAEQARNSERAAAERCKQLDRQPKRLVTLADLEGRELPTLRQAARVVLEEYRGRIEAKDGRLVISVPELLTVPGGWDASTSEQVERQRVHDATRVLIAARDHVLQEINKRGRLDQLRDVQVGADGTVA
jgi:hypothetical protein